MKYNEEYLKKAKRMLKDFEGFNSYRFDDNQTLTVYLHGPYDRDSSSEMDVLVRALEHYISHLESKNPCPSSIPVLIVSKEKAKKLIKQGKGRMM